MKRSPDGPLYLKTAVLTLRETSHPSSVPSSDFGIKITASNTPNLLENEPVKK
jgi:hypothetical protein